MKAVALPIANPRDLEHHHSIGELTNAETLILTLVGVALGISLLLAIVCCCYCRLRAEHEALSKDKMMGGSLRRMWERFQNFRQRRRERGSGVQYSRVPLSMAEDNNLDDDLRT